MTERLVVKTFLVILLMHAWMDEVLTAEVLSKFIGYWNGTATRRSKSWTIVAGIIGGSTNSTVGIVHILREKYDFCAYKLKLTAEDDKVTDRNESVPDTFESHIEELGNMAGFCPFGKFNFEALTKDRIVIDWTWLDDDGKATDEVSTILDRFDDGQLAKKLKTCKSKSPLTPVAKLKKKLQEDKKKQKRKQKRG